MGRRTEVLTLRQPDARDDQEGSGHMTYIPYEELPRPSGTLFSGLPSAAPGTVLVVDRVGQPLRALLTHSDRLTAGESRWGRIRTLYRVDVNEYPIEFSQVFPCKDDNGGFQAGVRLMCRVEEPESIVRRGLRDAERVLVPPISETIRRVCRRYEAEDLADAEEEALAAVRNIENGRRHDPAFRITQVAIELALDPAAAAFVEQLKEDRRTSAKQRSQARIEQERAEHEARLAREQAGHDALLAQERAGHDARLAQEQDRLDAERARIAAGFEQERHEIQRKRQQMEAELEADRVRLAIERDKLVAEQERQRVEAALQAEQLRLDRYVAMLTKGEFGIFAMQLLEDPSSIRQVGDRIARQRNAEMAQRMEALRLLLANDAIEGWEISEKAKTLLGQLLDIWNSPGPAEIAAGVPQDRPEIEDGQAPAGVTTPAGQSPAATSPTDDAAPGMSGPTPES
jgi:hypothetical protein